MFLAAVVRFFSKFYVEPFNKYNIKKEVGIIIVK